jgi:hypothetical protein
VIVEIDGVRHPVSLEFADIDDGDVTACLDVIHSEWGRPHHRAGHQARTLAASSRALQGGHILVRPPSSSDIRDVSLRVEIETTSLGATETLRAQYADARTGQWIDLDVAEQTRLDRRWERLVYDGTLNPLSADDHQSRVERLLEDARPDVEIVSVKMSVEGEDALSVRERQPFAITVRVAANREVPLADVLIKFIRTDGFYVFWQSSGQSGANLASLAGQKDVTFHFDPNLFGAGDYEVSIDVANGFDIERNWPHSQVFDRRVGALRFTVAREWPLLMLGPVNHCFPVTVSDGPEQAGVAGGSATTVADSGA